MPHAFICDYIRTPIGRYGGALAGVRTDDLAALPIKELIKRNSDMDWAAVDEVFMGCANQAGEDNRNVARMATLLAGLPESVPGTTINRLCGSGMDAILIASRSIKAGEMDIAIAGGVEGMSRAPFVTPKSTSAYSRNAEIYDTTIGWRFINQHLDKTFGTDSMPETAENVAREYNISRQDQDAFAARSQIRASAAQASGRLKKEIAPVEIKRRKGEAIWVENDEHPRAGTTAEKLAKLPTPFRNDGTITAGNASGVNDGAAALIIASARGAEKYGLTPIARICGGATAGIEPRIMGIGPVPATLKLCKYLELTPKDFDTIELNEAFAAQALATLRQLEIADDAEHVNPNGGAIALGHPLGMSGARITGTAALELKLKNKSLALATMCVGVGQGISIALERV